MQSTSTTEPPDDPGGRTTISDFESGLDGWTTNGGNDLGRVAWEDARFAVSGTHAMRVTVNGDRYPMVETRAAIEGVDLAARPYLFADVVPGQVPDGVSELTFRFRLRHSRGPSRSKERGGGKPKGRGRGTGDGGGGGPASGRPALESEPMTARPHERTTLRWDLSGVDDGKLAGAKRLELSWYPTEHPPRDHDRPQGRQTPSGRGKGGGDFEYRGEVIVDDVYAMENAEAFASAELDAKWRDLQSSHGVYQGTRSVVRSEHREEGEYVFDDGTAVGYVVEVVDDGKIRYVVDDVATVVEVPR